mmetsp:Transcript_19927/g.66374  ORF Transcript_19927/g.66374 Transcript_19927/m.66374 type:complete len:530 (-) Transcript_19927:120-1709(-)
MVGAPIGFALLVPRVCAACKRSDPPCSLQPFQPLAEDAMLCQDCMRRSEFRTITKTRAIEEYGVTEEVLAKLRYMTKKSRQGYMMKLYLEKQVAEHGTRRGGGSDVCVQARIDEMLAPHKKQKLSEGIVEEQQEARGREEGNEFPSASNLATSPDMVRKKMELLYRGSSHGKRMQQASDPLAETLACCLPEELLIRTDVLSSRPGWSAKGEGGGGGFILYVMQTAMRMEENHALEVATRVANACLLPVFVVLPLISDDVIANERRWTFILQGVPEIQEALRCKLGIMSHVLVDGYRGCDAMADLISLSKRASCVVQEDMPVLPYRRWADELAAHASVLLVDTACVLPMKEVGRAYASASSFRSATANRRQEYMGRRLQTSAPSCKLFVPEGLEPLCLSSSSSSSSSRPLLRRLLRAKQIRSDGAHGGQGGSRNLPYSLALNLDRGRRSLFLYKLLSLQPRFLPLDRLLRFLFFSHFFLVHGAFNARKLFSSPCKQMPAAALPGLIKMRKKLVRGGGGGERGSRRGSNRL